MSIMKTTVVLLVASVAVVLSTYPDTVRLHRNKMIDLVDEWINTTKGGENDVFVERVNKDPRNKFFCKVQKILESQKDTRAKEIGKSLKRFNKAICLNCVAHPQNLTTTPRPVLVRLTKVMGSFKETMMFDNLRAPPTKSPCN